MVGSANEQPTVRETETVSAEPSFAGGLCRAAPDHRSFGRSAGRLVVWSYCGGFVARQSDRKSTRLNSSHDQISYAVFCLKKKKTQIILLVLILYIYCSFTIPPLFSFFFFNDTATTEIYTLSLHDALPI